MLDANADDCQTRFVSLDVTVDTVTYNNDFRSRVFYPTLWFTSFVIHHLTWPNSWLLRTLSIKRHIDAKTDAQITIHAIRVNSAHLLLTDDSKVLTRAVVRLTVTHEYNDPDGRIPISPASNFRTTRYTPHNILLSQSKFASSSDPHKHHKNRHYQSSTHAWCQNRSHNNTP